MPWTKKSILKHNKKARRAGPKAQRQMAHVANSVLERTGDEGRAIAAANSVFNRRKAKKATRRSRARARGR